MPDVVDESDAEPTPVREKTADMCERAGCFTQGDEPHECPYSEISGRDELCNCCDYHTWQCWKDV